MDNNNKKAVYSKYFPLLLCAGIIMVVTIVLYVLGANDIIKLPNDKNYNFLTFLVSISLCFATLFLVYGIMKKDRFYFVASGFFYFLSFMYVFWVAELNWVTIVFLSIAIFFVMLVIGVVVTKGMSITTADNDKTDYVPYKERKAEEKAEAEKEETVAPKIELKSFDEVTDKYKNKDN